MLAMAFSISSSECSRSTNSPALLTVVVRLRDGGVRLVATGGEERTPDSWVGQRVEAVVVRPVNPDQPAYTTSLTALTYEGVLEEVNDRAGCPRLRLGRRQVPTRRGGDVRRRHGRHLGTIADRGSSPRQLYLRDSTNICLTTKGRGQVASAL